MDKIVVWRQPDPLRVDLRTHAEIDAGATLARALDAAGAVAPGAIYWDGRRIEPDPDIVITHGVLLIIDEMPTGGGNTPVILQSVLAVAMIVAGAYTGNYYLVAAGGTQLVGAGYSYQQQREAEKIAKYGRAEAPKSRSLAYEGLQNAADPWGAVPRIFGQFRAVPPYAAVPITEIVGNTRRVTAVFALSYGPIAAETLRIGETAIAEFQTEHEFRRGYLPSMITDRGSWDPGAGWPSSASFGDTWTAIAGGSVGGQTVVAGNTITYNGLGLTSEATSWDFNQQQPLALYSQDVYQDSIGLKLVYDGAFASRTTQVNADEISVDLAFPSGLYRVSSSKGNYVKTRLDVSIRYRLVGASAWIDIPAQRVEARETGPHFWGHRWATPSRGQYEVEVKYNNRLSTSDDTIVDETWWAMLRTHTREEVITAPGVALLAVRAIPTEMSQGTLDAVNCVVTTIARDWDGSAWAWRPTRNPASLVLHALQVAPAHAVGDDLVDLDAFARWHEMCAAEGWSFDQYVDWEETRSTMVERIARCGRAVIGYRPDGRIAPHLDRSAKPVAAIFSATNSSAHAMTQHWDRVPHALRVAYADAGAGWTTREVIVYADGQSEATATDIRQIDLPGVTSRELAWRHGRMAWAAAARRRSTRTCEVDLEACLGIEIMDHVVVASDVLEHATISGRVLEATLDGDSIIAIRGDAGLSWDGLEQQAISVYASGQTPVTARLALSAAGDYWTFPLAQSLPATAAPEGAVYIVGPVLQEAESCLITAMEPIAPWRARLTMVPYAQEIYSADDGDLPPWQARIRSRVLPAPEIVSIRSDAAVMRVTASGALIERIVIATTPVQMASDVRLVAMWRPVDGEVWSIASSRLDAASSIAIEGVQEGEAYQIRLRHEARDWQPSAWTTATQSVVVIGESAVPASLSDFSAVVQGSSILVRWAPIAEVDVRIGGWIEWRHSALEAASWSGSTPLGLTTRGDADSAWLPFRPGWLLARVFDRGGRAAAAPNVVLLADHEISQYAAPVTLWESTAWGGTHNGTELYTAGAAVMLSLEYSGGETWDDVPDVDAVDDVDAVGAGDEAPQPVAYGVYTWAGRMDLGTRKRVLLRMVGEVASAEEGDVIAARSTPIIEWPAMGDDGDIIAGDVEIWCAVTDQDPASPAAVWSDLFRVDSAHVYARGIGRLETRITLRDRAARVLVGPHGISAYERTG